jgi:hypothetical protein
MTAITRRGHIREGIFPSKPAGSGKTLLAKALTTPVDRPAEREPRSDCLARPAA